MNVNVVNLARSFLGASLVCAQLFSSSALAVPSARIGTAALIDPGTANSAFPTSSDGTHTNSLGSTGRPAEVVELARALNNDPDLIYAFVRNNVEMVWMYGLQKGPIGTIVDRSGTSFDQANLMVELLRQAGYTAGYEVGTLSLDSSQLASWTGITSAAAACQLFASGGIPASINGTSNTAYTNCASLSGSVTSVSVAHIWVTASIGGTTYRFDPSFKPHTFKSGIDLASAAGFSSGSIMSASSTGMTSGTASGVPYSVNMGYEGMSSTLQSAATSLLNYVRNNTSTESQDYYANGEIEDLIGGAVIQRYEGASVRVTSIAGTTVQRTWSGDIPDQFRTSLRVQATKMRSNGTEPQIVDSTLFTDEIYGRKLVLGGSFHATGGQTVVTFAVVSETGVQIKLLEETFADNSGFSVGTLTMTINHPYPASDDGSVATGMSYMDAVVTKEVRYSTPLTIVHGWGDTGREMVEKWGTRLDTAMPYTPSEGGCETCNVTFRGSQGDGRREQLAVSWLAQSSRAARLHAAIAKSVYTHHHSVGVVAADASFKTVTVGTSDGPDYTHYSLANSFDRVDVNMAFSVTSKTADSIARRAAVHAIAETSEALEGSVAAQIADLPDTTSTATRFEWGNRPPLAEDEGPGTSPAKGSPRRFYEFSSTTVSPTDCTNAPAVTCDLLKTERQITSDEPLYHSGNTVDIENTETRARRSKLGASITSYVDAGYNVVVSEEAFLGPGQRGGSFDEITTAVYAHRDSLQRGGAFVATRYVDGEPAEIAHIAVNGEGMAKGGGGGAQTGHDAQYDPSTAADILRARFVDKSKALGVDLLTGGVSATSPASLTVGNGGFPYALSANLIWMGGNERTTVFGPVAHTEPQTPWSTNWNNTLTVSGSGLEMMGDGDVRATAATIVAFMAAQDVYKNTPSIQREVTGVLIGAWWVRQLTGNIVTANIGADTRQFVKLVDGTWLATGAGSYATLTQTGSRTVEEKADCGGGRPAYVLTRGWNYEGMSFTVKNAQGDQQLFQYWESDFQTSDSDYCAYLHGFRLTSWTFPQGVTINLTYSTPGVDEVPELLEVSNSLGRKISFVDSGRGGFSNGLSGTDERSVIVSGSYLVPGTLTHTDPSGAATKYVFSEVGEKYRLDQIFDADSSTTPALQYEYDSLRRVKEARDAVALKVGGRSPYQFLIADGLRGERIDPAGGRYIVDYDSRKRPFRFTDELGRQTQAKYDSRGRVLEYTYPEGDKEKITYDDRNNPTKMVKTAKSGGTTLTVEANWNTTWNKPNWIRDARGNQTDLTYYSSGNGASLINTATRPADADGTHPVYSFTYNSRGQVLTATDPTGLVISNTYHSTNGNLLTTTLNPSWLNATMTYGYDGIGNIASITDPRGYTAENSYDNNRRKTVTMRHEGGTSSNVIAAQKTTYDLLGQVTKEEGGVAFSGVAVTSWQALKEATYTKTGKVYTEVNGEGNTTTYSYDSLDRVFQVQDPMSRQTRFEYDLAGQMLREIRAYNTAIQQNYATYTYTLNGQHETVKDANNNVSKFFYDGFDRLVKLCFPQPTLGAGQPSTTDCEQYQYDNNGNRTQLTKRDGQVISYSYDSLNREVLKDVPASASDVYTKYDLASRPLFKRFASLTGQGIDYGYDAAKRLTSETTFGRAVAFGYDTASNRIRLQWPDGNYIGYGFDALNRMSEVRENSATSGVGVLQSYSWDSLSRRSTVSRANGTSTGYAYDLASRLSTLSHNLSGTSQDFTLTLGYTAASQLQSRTTSNTSFGWWTAPQQSNLYVANGLNQYTSVGGVTFTNDANGNLTSDGSRTFAYDVENRLVSVSGSVSVTFSYDPLGRLASQQYGGATTNFLYDGDRLIAEYDQSGNILRRHVHGPGVDDPIVWYEDGGLTDKRWMHQDERGSIIAYSDSSGAATAYSYGPYGELTSWSGSRFKYTGQIMLPEVQLYYYKARVYDPKWGRFLQTDPVGYSDDVNLYAYVGNDPLNRVDPTGTDSCTGSLLGNGCAFVSGSTERSEMLSGSKNAGGSIRASEANRTAAAAGAAIGAGVALAGSVVADIGTAGVNIAATPAEVAAGAAMGATVGVAVADKGDEVVSAVSNANQQLNMLIHLVVHGNSLLSTRQTYVYQLVSERTNAILKYGITSAANPQSRYPSLFYRIGNFRMEVITSYPTRWQARADEISRCTSYAASHGGSLPPLSITC